MKKILFTAAMAGIMLAGCTSENDNFNDEQKEKQQISFAAPVMQGLSRAYTPIAGEIIGKYPKTEQFKVFGKRYKGTEAYPGWDGALTEYRTEGEDTEYNVSLRGWDTKLSHFWIDGYKYAFAAMSPATQTGVTYTAAGVQIASFAPAAMGSQYDLLYAPRIYDVVRTDMTTGNDGATAYNGVNLKFRHALSSVIFKIGVHPDYDEVDGAQIADGVFKIKSIKISGVDGEANFNQNITADQKTGYAETPTWTENTATTASYVFLDKGEGSVNVPAKTTASTVKDAMTNIDDETIGGNNAILIPQPFTADAKIQIVWTSNGNEADANNVIWYTTEISLKDNTSESQWKVGKRYIYNLAFKRNKIYFNPTVEDWTDATESDNTIDK